MSDAATSNADAKSYLEMSDEEIGNLPPPSVENFSSEVVEPANDENSDPLNNDEATVIEEDPENKSAETLDVADDDKADDAVTPQATPPVADSVSATEKDPVTETLDATKPEAQNQIDYKAEYEKVFAPFKANGRDITIKSAEDAISLMQMGANYNKKMAALKPNLKLLKLLEKNELLDEAKLSYLIDLDKKNPEAINKLVKDSGLDPMDFDAEKASGYKPKTYTVDEREMELDTILGDIKDTPSYTRTLEVVGNKWDGASRQVIADTPQLLKVIHGHIANGVYDIIAAQVEQDRTFGRLDGLTDIEAYRKVGDAIQARGGFDHLGIQGNQPSKGTIVTPPKPKVDDVELRDKKRAASSTKPAPAKAAVKEFNPLAMSDEEFSKQGIDKFL